MFDTTLAIARMIYDGFFDTYPNLKIIAAHAGATIPYTVGRLDRLAEKRPKVIDKITRPPSEYLQQIYFDAVCYRLDALKFCLDVVGSANLMYGSDYPHSIGDMKGCLARVDALPKEHVEAVRGGNATRIFGL
jgi:aminocarboxymuconate-semialdehyde decarboxylase